MPDSSDDNLLDKADLDLLFGAAHTTYRFTDEPVSDDELRAIYEHLRWAPTAQNSQPLRIAYVRTPEAKERLLRHLPEGNRPKSISAPVVAILAADTDFHEHLPHLWPHMPAARDAFAADDERRHLMARMNAAIQAGYFLLTARALGLSVGPMGGFDAPGVDAEFFAGTPLHAFLLVNLGHASDDGTQPRNPRLAVEDAVTFL